MAASPTPAHTASNTIQDGDQYEFDYSDFSDSSEETTEQHTLVAPHTYETTHTYSPHTPDSSYTTAAANTPVLPHDNEDEYDYYDDFSDSSEEGSEKQHCGVGQVVEGWQRQERLRELVSTEHQYIWDLEVLLKVVNDISNHSSPACDSYASMSVPDASSISSTCGNIECTSNESWGARASLLIKPLLGNLPQVLDVARRFLAGLEEASESGGIGRIFVNFSCELCETYKVYCSHYNVTVIPELKKLEQNDDTRDILKVTALELRRHKNHLLDLNSVLIKPVQRVLKYPLYLDELMRDSPATDPDLDDLREAMTCITNVAKEINEYTRTIDIVHKYRGETDRSLTGRIRRVNLHSLAKKRTRVSLYVSHMLGLAGQTNSSAWVAAEAEFLSVYRCAQALVKGATRLQDAVRARHQAELAITEALVDILECPRVSSLHDTTTYTSTTLYQQYDGEVESRVLGPARAVVAACEGPKRLMQKRTDKLLDLEAAVGRLQATKDAQKSTEEVAGARQTYEALEARLLEEVPVLCRHARELLGLATQALLAARLYFQGHLAHRHLHMAAVFGVEELGGKVEIPQILHQPWTSKDKGPGIKENTPGTKDKGPGTKDKGPGTKDKGSGTKDKGPGTKDKGPGTKDKGSGTKDKGPQPDKPSESRTARLLQSSKRAAEFLTSTVPSVEDLPKSLQRPVQALRQSAPALRNKLSRSYSRRSAPPCPDPDTGVEEEGVRESRRRSAPGQYLRRLPSFHSTSVRTHHKRKKTLLQKYPLESLFEVVSAQGGGADNELVLCGGALVAVLQHRDPMGGAERWVVDDGEKVGLVKSSSIKPYKQTDGSKDKQEVESSGIEEVTGNDLAMSKFCEKSTHLTNFGSLVCIQSASENQNTAHFPNYRSVPSSPNINNRISTNINQHETHSSFNINLQLPYAAGWKADTNGYFPNRYPCTSPHLSLPPQNNVYTARSNNMTIQDSRVSSCESVSNLDFGIYDVPADLFSSSANSENCIYEDVNEDSTAHEDNDEQMYTGVELDSSLSSPQAPTTKDTTENTQVYYSLYDFAGGDATQIDLCEGQRVSAVDRGEGWWYVQDCQGNRGYVPASYLRPARENTRL